MALVVKHMSQSPALNNATSISHLCPNPSGGTLLLLRESIAREHTLLLNPIAHLGNRTEVQHTRQSATSTNSRIARPPPYKHSTQPYFRDHHYTINLFNSEQ